ncbi:hypothetical protein C8T65DRAFT_634108 [Cerioporus squamosus]|nr:hypothetical protein C8T65DRAFT_634108 [Cerioporus squamosus]
MGDVCICSALANRAVALLSGSFLAGWQTGYFVLDWVGPRRQSSSTTARLLRPIRVGVRSVDEMCGKVSQSCRTASCLTKAREDPKY